MKIFLKERVGFLGSSNSRVRFGGWGNGYIIIPPGHKLYGIHYDDIASMYAIHAHGGLTFGEVLTPEYCEAFGLLEDFIGYYMIGFDTMHFMDDLNSWPYSQVFAETCFLEERVRNVK